MIEISHFYEKERIRGYPREVKEVIKGIVQILDHEYGSERLKYEDNGGYIAILENEDDFYKMKYKAYIDCDDIIPEYVDKILCENGEVYANALILCNSDYTISLIIPLALTPQNLKNYMVD